MGLVRRRNTSITDATHSLHQITENSDLAKMKKELTLLREEMEREKISNAEFRNAHAKRQKDETSELVASEIEKYFANTSNDLITRP